MSVTAGVGSSLIDIVSLVVRRTTVGSLSKVKSGDQYTVTLAAHSETLTVNSAFCLGEYCHFVVEYKCTNISPVMPGPTLIHYNTFL